MLRHVNLDYSAIIFSFGSKDNVGTQNNRNNEVANGIMAHYFLSKAFTLIHRLETELTRAAGYPNYLSREEASYAYRIVIRKLALK